MDRVVCVILLAVAASLVLDNSNAAPQNANGQFFPVTDQSQTQPPGTVVTDAAGRTFNLAPLQPLQNAPFTNAPFSAAQQQQPARYTFVDSIFQVSADDTHHHHRILRAIRQTVVQPLYNRKNNSRHKYPYLIRFNQTFWMMREAATLLLLMRIYKILPGSPATKRA